MTSDNLGSVSPDVICEGDGGTGLVSQAIYRYFQRFPRLAELVYNDGLTSTLFWHIKRTLVQADAGMQNEGLSYEVRERIISHALYNSVDEAEAAERMNRQNEEMDRLMGQNPVRFLLPRDGL